MKFLFLAITVFAAFQITCAQNTLPPTWKIGVNGGWTKSTTSDLLINHYNYSGSSFSNLNLYLTRYKVKQILNFNLILNKSTLYPRNLNPLYYEYNYLDGAVAEFTISYLYKVVNTKHIQLSVGGCNGSFYSVQDEFHRNILYPFGLDHRKSYVVSPVNLMPMISADYILQKNSVRAEFGYAIVNISARPDDNYVKQIGDDKGRDWHAYFPGGFSTFRYSIDYQYGFKRLSATAKYEVIYNSIDGDRGYKSFQRMLWAGINYSL